VLFSCHYYCNSSPSSSDIIAQHLEKLVVYLRTKPIDNGPDWWRKGPRINSESGHCQVTTLGSFFTHMCLYVTKQYNSVSVNRWHSLAGKVTAGLVESNGSLVPTTGFMIDSSSYTRCWVWVPLSYLYLTLCLLYTELLCCRAGRSKGWI